jgi:hypothetical protein
MEHVEAYGMPSGTRAGYLMFYLFAEHALQSGLRKVGIGTGVTESSVKKILETAKQDQNEKGVAEANRNMAAVHMYKELGFDASDAMTLSNSSVATTEIRSLCRQKMSDFWFGVDARVLNVGASSTYNATAITHAWNQLSHQQRHHLVQQLTQPLPPDHAVFNNPGAIGDDDL